MRDNLWRHTEISLADLALNPDQSDFVKKQLIGNLTKWADIAFDFGGRRLNVLFVNKWSKRFHDFDLWIDGVWDGLIREYKVKWFYDLPEKVREAHERIIANEWLKLYNEVTHAIDESTDPDYKKFLFALRMYLRNGYGYSSYFKWMNTEGE